MVFAPARMPVLFVGHGSPLNAIEDNVWSQGFRAMGALLPKPRAILSISAHWFVSGTFLTDNLRPKTIHDFGGFPRALFDVQYSAPGAPALARRVASLVGEDRASLRSDWGLDHGTWTVLRHLRPAADVPVVQLSVHAALPPKDHLALGRALAPLRDEGVLIMGSGNVTHNLPFAMQALRNGNTSTPPWALSFDAAVERATRDHDEAFLAALVTTDAGRLNHPTPDHYLPLLYAVGATAEGDSITFPITGFDAGSLSMRSILFGSVC